MKNIFVCLLLLLVCKAINAQGWSALGSGMSDIVVTMVEHNGELYVGGRFTNAGGVPANYIAKWNGSSWSAVGSGMNTYVNTVAVYNTALYAGGNFTMADGNSANYIAKWNGSSWTSLGSGTNELVLALAVYNGELYVGGGFTSAGGNSANYIAKWNGTSWSAVGGGMNDAVRSLGIYNGELYAGGSFTMAGGNTANHIAKWNGTSWSSVGTGVNNNVGGLAEYNGDLYASGSFTTAGGNAANYIAKWDGSTWTAVGSGTDNLARGMAVIDPYLYVGGWFLNAGGVPANYVAKWDGTSWSAVGSGMNNLVNPLGVYSGELYAGGIFTMAEGNTVNYIAHWSEACANAPPQPGIITGNNSVCQGTSQTYSITSVSGATSYSWTLPGGWTGTSTTTSITATAGANGGDISVIAINGCGSSPAQTKAVTVNPILAQPGAITGGSSVCQGSSQTYSIAAVNGANSYTWTLPSGGGWTGSSTTNSIMVTVGSISGNISVTANNTCGSSPSQTKAITVLSPPAQPQDISGSITVCQGSSQTYSISAVNGATNYTWSLPPGGGWSGSSTSNSITATAGPGSGDISVTANNTCGSSTEQSLFVTVAPVPIQPGSISGSNMVCDGSNQTYSISPVSGAVGYNWTIPTGWTGSSTTNSIDVSVGPNGGNLSVKANNSCGSSTAQLLAVIVSAAPAQPGPISGSISVCQGSSQLYSVGSVSEATSYLWTLPGGWTGTSTTNSITAMVGVSGGDISVMAINSCGSSSVQTLSITINPVPAQPGAINGNNTVCQGSSQTYSIGEVPGATSYSWTLPSGWTGSSTTNSITATVGGTSDSISVIAHNSCGNSTAKSFAVTVNSIPTQPDTISGNLTVCQGGVQIYSVNAVSGATSYSWILPSGWTGSSSSDSIEAIIGVSGGNISVIANNFCGSSNAQSLVVIVSTVPSQPGAITGNNSVCQGNVQTYSINPVSDATGYTWTLPAGWTGISNTTSITTTVGASAGNISVTADNSCGSSIPQTLIVDNSAPEQPGSISGNESVCEGTSQTYSISPVAGAISYTWTLPDGWTGGSNTTSITTTVNNTSGSVSVTSNNSCGNSTPQTFPVSVIPIPLQPDTIIGNTSVNVGQELIYSINDIPGATGYIWSLNGGGIITSGQNTTSVTVNWQTAGNDTLSISAINDCGTGSAQNLPIIVSVASALIELNDPFEIKVMPNPFQEELYLTATGVVNKEMYVEIFNLAGQIIFNRQLKAESNDFSQLIELGQVPAGLYQAEIRIDGKVYVRTLVALSK